MKPLQQVEHAPESISSLNNSPSSIEELSLSQVLSHSSTLFHIWFRQNVYPLVTPKRILCFCLSQISFLIAYAFFTQTEFYNSHINRGDHDDDHQEVPPLIFLVAAFGIHTVCLIFLMFFSFCSVAFQKCRYHYLLKSLGEYLVKLLVVFLIVGIGEEHHHHYPVEAAQGHHHAAALAPAPTTAINHNNFSQVAMLATWCFLTIDAFSIVNLLEPGHHYTLLEVTVSLTLHLGLTMQNNFHIPAAAFVLVTVVLKNYLSRDTQHDPQPPTIEPSCPVAWVPSQLV